MGCYGIGLGRLLGAVVEVLSDEKGLVWPEEVAPAPLHIVDLTRDEKNKEVALALYHKAQVAHGTVIFDDRDIGAGEKLTDADLLGMPVRIVISDRTLEKEAVEITTRRDGETKEISLSQFENEYLRI
jgi:prolyl-tRNA synthetase